MRKLITSIILAVVASHFTGCDGKPVDWVKEGWKSFEEGDYPSAITNFQQAITENASDAEAYNGLGWCYLFDDSLSKSITNFEASLSFENLIDANAGVALALAELSDFSHAVTHASVVINASPSYVFSHHTSVDIKMIRLTKAKSAAALGDFTTALNEVKAIESAFDADPSTPEGQAAILQKIEELISG